MILQPRKKNVTRLFALVLLMFGVLGLAGRPAHAAPTLEAENLTISPGAGQVYDDGSASAGKGVLLWSNGTATGNITIPANARVTIRAKGDQCSGAPQMAVKVGLQTVMNTTVPATTWTDYTADVGLAAGTYPFSIAFTNDFMGGGCDRNLRLDSVNVTATSTQPVSAVEAEGMLMTPGAGQNYTDSVASGGQAALIWSNGDIRQTVTTNAAGRIVVRAMGDQCSGAPHMTVTLDGVKVIDTDVSTTTWTDYGANTSLAAGSHTIIVAFTNDYSGGCDRNLKVDKISFTDATATQPPPPPANPQPTVEAESLTLTSGAGQTYADSTASGGNAVLVWSGGNVSGTVNTPSAGRMVVRAQGDQCSGAPQMTVKLDGTAVLTSAVAATAWTEYGQNVTVSAGSHTISVSFDNDFMGGGCDRNLRVDKVSFTAAISPEPPPPPATTGKWNTYKGFNFMSWNREGYLGVGADNSFNQLASTGANAVSIPVIWFQNSGSDNSMFMDGGQTSSDQAVIAAIQRAKKAGMKVMLRPMVNTYGNATWRGSFQPSDKNTWYANYRTMINHYADVAMQYGADLLEVGSEYNSLQGDAAQWRQVVAQARQRFVGKLVYSANWDTYMNVSWFDAVDIIGVDAYFPLYNGTTPDVATVINRWSNNPDAWGPNTSVMADITNVHNRFNKPVIFGELGYRSGSQAMWHPWDTGGAYAPDEQQRALQGTFQAWDGKDWFLGMFIWQWNADPTAGGPGDTDHTPQRKPAQQTVTERFTST